MNNRSLPSVLILAVALAGILVPGVAASGAAPYPVLGVDPVPQGIVVENHPDALPHWVERGVTGAVLLHVDVNNDLRVLEAGKLAGLKALRERGDLQSLFAAGRGGESGLFHDGNFITAAARLGVVREVVWVVPFTVVREEDGGAKLKAFLGREGMSAEDIGTFRPVDGCYRGSVGDLPVTLCGQDRLPRIDAPVLLSLDIGFFPYAADDHGFTLLTAVRTFFGVLREARYSVQDVVVAYSVQTEQLPVDLRWVGEAVVEILHDPALIQTDAPPEQWLVLQRLFLLRTTGQKGENELLDVALSLLEKQPHNPALLFFAAEATVRHGSGSASLSYAEQACKVDKGYCSGLREIGLQVSDRGDIESAARFFAAGERLLPGMEYRDFDMGIALWRAGRTAEALEAMGRVGGRYGAFPSGFVIGTMHLALGDRAAARLAFDKALAMVEGTPAVVVARREVAAAVERAAAFYREEGLTRQATLLETDPRLQFPPREAAP